MRVDHNDLQKTAAELRDIATDLIDIIRSLSSQAECLMSETWTGAAAESHFHTWTGWSEAARRLVCSLGHDAQLIDRVAADFAERDETVARSVA